MPPNPNPMTGKEGFPAINHEGNMSARSYSVDRPDIDMELPGLSKRKVAMLREWLSQKSLPPRSLVKQSGARKLRARS
jgi:hypothetical protein